MTTTKQTTAETVAALFGNDGQQFSRRVQSAHYGEIDECLMDTCEQAGATIRRGENEGRGSFVAYEFADGSAIVACGGSGWDVRHADCSCGFCWAGQFSDECRHARDERTAQRPEVIAAAEREQNERMMRLDGAEPVDCLEDLLALVPSLDERALAGLPTFGGEAPASVNGVFSWDAARMLVQDRAGWRIVSRSDYEPLAKCHGSDGDGCDSEPCDAEDLTEIRTVPDYQRGTAKAAGTTTGVEVTRLLCAGCYDALIEHLRATPADREWYMDSDGDRLVE